MTKQEKFQKIIEFLKQLDAEQFRYDDVVAIFDLDSKCGTVCCVLGWFPSIFPEDYKWGISNFGDWMTVHNKHVESTDSKTDSDFLDISSSHLDALFYGMTSFQNDLGLPETHIESNLSQVIHLFEEYYRLYIVEPSK